MLVAQRGVENRIGLTQTQANLSSRSSATRAEPGSVLVLILDPGLGVEFAGINIINNNGLNSAEINFIYRQSNNFN